MSAGAGGGASVGTVAAAIDVGSNSVLLLLVMAATDGGWMVRDEALATTRLGSGLRAGGALDPAARSRTRDAVLAFAARARDGGAEAVWGFATGAARDAADGAAFAGELAAAGVPTEVLTGDREARLAFAASAGISGPGSRLAIDVGGRTTELTLGAGTDIVATVSLPLGALALTEAYIKADPPSPAEIAALDATVTHTLAGADLLGRVGDAAPVASGGTATALAALDLGLAAWDPVRVHGHSLAAEALTAMIARLVALPVAARARPGVLDPARASILPAGAIVLCRVLAASGAPALRVSERGVRHAYLAERLASMGVRVDPVRLGR